jgi:ribosomal-protein-alanine N-acetyltransferase
MNIRPYSPADLWRLHAIDQAAFEPSLAWTLSELRSFIAWPHSCTLVAEHENEPIGFVTASLVKSNTGHISTLDVLPAWQRQGVGSQLLAAIEEWLWKRGAKRVLLETSVGTEGAREFYERYGYAVVDRLANYYGRRRDAWLMARNRTA